MGAIFTSVFVLLLWLLVRWGRLDRWPKAVALIVGLVVLGLALLLQYIWLALVLEGWRYAGPPSAENSWAQPIVEGIITVTRLGRKTGWFVVAATGIVCLWRTWRQPAAGVWLIGAARQIATLSLSGTLLELFAPLQLIIPVQGADFAAKPYPLVLIQVILCILLLVVLFVIMIKHS